MILDSIKAIFGGFLAILIMGLLVQLMILFVGAGYSSLVKAFPSLSYLTEITIVLAFAVTATIGFLGGILTAGLARKAVVFHCVAVGSIVGMLTLVPSLIDGYEITVNGVLFIVIFMLATVVGGLYWKKRFGV